MFVEGREDVADEDRSTGSSSQEQRQMCAKNESNTDRRLSVRLMSDRLYTPKSSVHRIVSEELLMRKMCAKLMPKVLKWRTKGRPRRNLWGTETTVCSVSPTSWTTSLPGAMLALWIRPRVDEYVPPGQAINARFYKWVLMKFTHRVNRVSLSLSLAISKLYIDFIVFTQNDPIIFLGFSIEIKRPLNISRLFLIECLISMHEHV